MGKLESNLEFPLSVVFIRFPLLRNWKKRSELGVRIFLHSERKLVARVCSCFLSSLIRFHLLWTKLVWRVRAHLACCNISLNAYSKTNTASLQHNSDCFCLSEVYTACPSKIFIVKKVRFSLEGKPWSLSYSPTLSWTSALHEGG